MLKIKNLTISYKTDKDPVNALRDVSLDLLPGESLGIIGESGAGKSTLAFAIMGLLPAIESKGSILFDDTEISGASEKSHRQIRWKRIAMVFQNSLETFNPVMTIGDQIAEPVRHHLQYTGKEADDYVAFLLEKTGLDAAWRHHWPHQLSGGMRQRAMFAMAISCRPEILIVDEPFSALDAENRHAMVHLVQELKEDIGFGLLLISHNMPSVQQLTGKVMTFYDGVVVEKGLTSEVLRTPLHPYTRGLINSVPEFFPYRDLMGIRGEPPVPGKAVGCPFAPRCVQRGQTCVDQRPALLRVGIERAVACHKNGIETILKARGITKTFQNGKQEIKALDDVNVTLRKGEVVALTGVSGSGKSTLAHILTSVLEPDSGAIEFNGDRVSGRSATARMGGIQIVFQDPTEAVSSRLTVMEAIQEPLDILKWGKRQDREKRVLETLVAVRLPSSAGFIGRTCDTLSGGQRQRLAIARALITDPAVLIADEMTAMLDPSTQATILRELRELQNSRGFSMLFITHEIHLARKTADRVCILNQGRVVEEGAAIDIFNHQHDAHAHRLFQAAFHHDRSVV